MKTCKKCNIKLDTIANYCPLCNSEIDIIKNYESSYPPINSGIIKHLFRKFIFFLVCLASIAVLIMNLIINPSIKWSLFVIIQLFLSYFVFYDILSGRKKVIKLLLVLNIVICSLSLFWDFYTGFHGWSTNYVFPSMCISYGLFMLILRGVNYYAFKENSSYIYVNICLEFIPLVLAYLEFAKYNILIYFSGAFGIINLLILIVFDSSNFKEDILKILHI